MKLKTFRRASHYTHNEIERDREEFSNNIEDKIYFNFKLFFILNTKGDK